jgi:hypothetical protein
MCKIIATNESRMRWHLRLILESAIKERTMVNAIMIYELIDMFRLKCMNKELKSNASKNNNVNSIASKLSDLSITHH